METVERVEDIEDVVEEWVEDRDKVEVAEAVDDGGVDEATTIDTGTTTWRGIWSDPKDLMISMQRKQDKLKGSPSPLEIFEKKHRTLLKRWR